MKEAAKIIIDPDHRIYDAKRRFDILLGGQSVDVWAAEVRCHLSCYRRFVYTGNDTLKQEIEDLFCYRRFVYTGNDTLKQEIEDLSCYRRFVYTGNDTLKQEIEDTKILDFVFNNLLADAYESVVRGSNAHLLSELLKV